MTEKVWECECGWWQIEYYSYMEEENMYKDWHKSVYSSQLRKFSIGDKSIPIQILRSYIEKNEDKVYEINDKKMEELVASVFSEHFKCDVRMVGKSDNGGVDLIMVESNKPTIIQVKRRKTPSKTENVKEIRDLLGTTLLSDSKKCIFVTTADHFSPDAINTRDAIIEKKIVDSFDLYGYRSFMDLLKLYKTDVAKVWTGPLQFEANLPESRKKLILD